MWGARPAGAGRTDLVGEDKTAIDDADEPGAQRHIASVQQLDREALRPEPKPLPPSALHTSVSAGHGL
jgi:hypothetical protein